MSSRTTSHPWASRILRNRRTAVLLPLPRCPESRWTLGSRLSPAGAHLLNGVRARVHLLLEGHVEGVRGLQGLVLEILGRTSSAGSSSRGSVTWCVPRSPVASTCARACTSPSHPTQVAISPRVLQAVRPVGAWLRAPRRTPQKRALLRRLNTVRAPCKPFKDGRPSSPGPAGYRRGLRLTLSQAGARLVLAGRRVDRLEALRAELRRPAHVLPSTCATADVGRALAGCRADLAASTCSSTTPAWRWGSSPRTRRRSTTGTRWSTPTEGPDDGDARRAARHGGAQPRARREPRLDRRQLALRGRRTSTAPPRRSCTSSRSTCAPTWPARASASPSSSPAWSAAPSSRTFASTATTRAPPRSTRARRAHPRRRRRDRVLGRDAPGRVNINLVEMMPADQGFGPFNIKRR